jgi:hypothetical protein
LATLFIASLVIMATACQRPPPFPSLEVLDQDIENNTVTIRRISIDKPGWVILHPSTPAGEPDLDARLVRMHINPGEYKDISVPLLTTIAGERIIFAMLYYDDPTDEEFTFSPDGTDDPPVEVGGNVVVKSFAITIRGAEVVSAIDVTDQDIEDESVVISGLVIDRPGWLVLYPATPDGTPDKTVVLAIAYLTTAGNYADINMPLATTITDEQTVFAVLHYDDPADKEFTFMPDGTDDPPVEVGGNALVKPFKVRD